ncbi:MAG: cytochrome P450 [Verrucomicrobiales bacterium]|jgi:cytochrome P450
MIDDDVLSPERVRDPYTYFREMQRETPVYWNQKYRAWFVTRFDDVTAAFREPRLSSDRIAAFGANNADQDEAFSSVLHVLSSWLVFKDPPDHTRLRRLLQSSFTVKEVESWRPRIERIVNELIDELDPEQPIDLVRDIAYPLPAIVIAEMLGVPPEDRELFKRCSDQITALVFGALDQPDRREQAIAGMSELTDYLDGLIRRHREVGGDDLMRSLIDARDENDSLTDDEVLSTCVLLLFGGHETTTSLIGSGMLALLDHPGELVRLTASPDQLMGPAIEEFLRYDGPAKVSVRIVAEQLHIRDQTLEAGSRLFLVPSAANRDPERFSDPDRLVLGREDGGHVGFGGGIHYCLGAPLARVEASVAIDSIVRRFRDIEFVDRDALEWHPTLLSRGLQSLPIRVSDIRTAS